jgi:glycosyltransferase involved in cell wall biosynthesis
MQPAVRQPSAEFVRPRVALFPWGSVLEDFLVPLGMTPTQFAQEMSGGWLFGFIEALRRQSVDTTIIAFSSHASERTRLVNPVTGVPTVLLPAGRLYRWLRRWPGDIDDPNHPPIRYRIRHLQHLVRYLATPRTPVAEALQAEGCTAILTQEYENPRFDVLTAVGRRLGLPVFASFQGAPPPSALLERKVRARTIHRADGLVIASTTEAGRVQTAYGLPAARVASIPNPVDLSLWHVESRRECRRILDIPASATIVVSHGRIDVPNKGLDVLVSAWRLLTARHPTRDWRLHLVGSGRDDEKLAALLAVSPLPGVRWVRKYANDRAEMRRELNAADIYVLASRWEGFPVAPLEAMACELPVVASAIPSMQDIVSSDEDGGVLVPVADAAALSEALERMLLDAEMRSRMGKRARQRVESYCSLDTVGQQLAALLATGRVC